MIDHEYKDTKADPIYEMDGITIINGDSLEIIPKLCKFNAIITDPPYGITDISWDKQPILIEMWNKLKDRVIDDNSGIIMTAAEPFRTDLIISNRQWFRYDMVWIKNAASNFLLAKKMPLKRHEHVLVFSKKHANYYPVMKTGYKPIKSAAPGTPEHYKIKSGRTAYVNTEGTRYPTSVLEYSLDTRKGKSWHPTQKPLALMEYLIQLYTKPGDIILDPYMGSGTTLIAAYNTGRRCIGIEISPEYCNRAIERLSIAKSLKESTLINN